MTAPTTAGLGLEGLSVGYSGRREPVLRGITVDAEPGEFVGLVGRNGAGKSTLLRTLARLQPALGGRFTAAGLDPAHTGKMAWSRRVAVVLTDHIGVDHLRVRDLVALGRHPHLGWSQRLSEHDHWVVEQSLAAVAASDLADEPYAALSDGQRQRIVLARALAQEPRVLLLDEPTSFLDPAARIVVLGLLQRLAAEREMVAVVSTHEVELALRHCGRLWVADGGTLASDTSVNLVAAGVVARAFATPGVEFSPATGRFEEASA